MRLSLAIVAAAAATAGCATRCTDGLSVPFIPVISELSYLGVLNDRKPVTIRVFSPCLNGCLFGGAHHPALCSCSDRCPCWRQGATPGQWTTPAAGG